MSCLLLTVDLPAGVTIKDACADAIELANKLNIKIRFEFNDKFIYALPHTNVDSLILAYKEAIKENSDIVCSFEKIQGGIDCQHLKQKFVE